MLETIGASAIRKCRLACSVAGVVWAFLTLVPRRSCWPRTVSVQLGRQILFTGIEASSLVLLISVLAGVSIVAQAQLWLSRFGQSEMLGPLLVAVIVKEAGPLLINMIVIGRSGTAIATEMATMRVHGEVALLEAQGLDAMIYLVLPRISGMVVSIFCLTMLLITGALMSGYMAGGFLGVTASDPATFAASVLGATNWGVIINLLAKTLVPGLLTAAICCVEGLSVRGAATEVPQAATRAVVNSIAALLIVSALVTVLTYA